MPHNDFPQPSRPRAAEFAALALVVAVPLQLVAVYIELGTISPIRRDTLIIAAMVLISDACFLFASLYGGTIVRVLAIVCGLVALLNTCGVLRVTAEILFRSSTPAA